MGMGTRFSIKMSFSGQWAFHMLSMQIVLCHSVRYHQHQRLARKSRCPCINCHLQRTVKGSVFCQKITQIGAWCSKDRLSVFDDAQTTLCKG